MLDWFGANFSNIITTIVMAVTVISVFFGMKSEVRIIRHDVRNIEKQLEHLSEALSSLGRILTQVAVQDSRLNMIEKNLDELRHGKGFVKTS